MYTVGLPTEINACLVFFCYRQCYECINIWKFMRNKKRHSYNTIRCLVVTLNADVKIISTKIIIKINHQTKSKIPTQNS